MSYGLSELKRKDNQLHFLLLENDTQDNSKYMFDEHQEFFRFYDYTNMYELDEDFETVSPEDTKFDYTEEEWEKLFRDLITKARDIDVEIKEVWV